MLNNLLIAHMKIKDALVYGKYNIKRENDVTYIPSLYG